jgi:hypothetical protein
LHGRNDSTTLCWATSTGARNEQTGAHRSTVSNTSGIHSLPSLGPGRYKITVEAKGFETSVREGVDRLPPVIRQYPFSMTLLFAWGHSKSLEAPATSRY